MRAFDLALRLVAAVVCLAFLLGVHRDTRASRPTAAAQPPTLPPPPVAETERDGTLRVQVTGREKAPLADVRVRIFWEQNRRYFDAGQANSDSSGRAELRRVPRGRVWVVAEAAGYARASSQLLMAGEVRDLAIELLPAKLLSVRVTDESHAPIADATVLVTTHDPLPYAALTDAAGKAGLDRLGAPPYIVKASVPGYESVTRSGVEADLTLALRRLGSLTIHVRLPDGTPAPGASVAIGGATLWPARTAEADPNGACKIAGLLAGSYDLRATLGQHVSRVLVGFLLDRGENKELTLILEPGRFVTALVTDGEGSNPHVVSNADVVLAEEGLTTFPLHGRSGTDGKLTLGPISNGPATLSGRAPDFIGSAVVAVPDTLTEPVRIPLQRGGTLLGEVVDARGFPVDGASVEVVGSDVYGLPIVETTQLLRFRRSHFAWALAGPPPLIAAGELGVMPGPIPPIPGSHAALATLALEGPGATLESDEELTPWVTGSGGRFRAAPVTPGRVRAHVRHPDFVEAFSEPVTLAPGAEAHVKVVMLRGGSLEGRVLDERSAPVDGAEVEIVAERGTFQRFTITASDGSFAFGSLPREVTLNVRRAENPTRVARRLPVMVEEGTKQTLEVILPALRDAVQLMVQDEDGRPIELAEVNALSLDPAAPLRTTGFSDATGRVTLADARGLELRLSVQAPGFARHALTLAAGDARESLALRLQRGVLVHGRVTALRGRQGVEGALVTLSSEGIRKTATTDQDGAYELKDVTPGATRLHVSHADFAEANLTASVEVTARQDRAFELPTVDLEEPGSVEGDVVDERGEPVAGARVAVGRAPSYVRAGALPRGVAITDARGNFSLRGLAAGSLTLDAFSPDRGRGNARVEVQSQRTTSGVRITLQSSGSDQDPFAPGGVAITLGERGSAPDVEVVIVSVAEGSEAERGGLRAGDVLALVGDAKPASMRDARAKLSGALQSDVVVGISRNGAAQRLSIAREAVLK